MNAGSEHHSSQFGSQQQYPAQRGVEEAASAGFIEIDLGAGTMRFPRLQIVTIEDLPSGLRPKMPIIDSTAFKRAKREETTKQPKLDL